MHFKALGLLAFLAIAPAVFSANAAFDRFVDGLTNEWVRADPNDATRSQFFSGPEQDELDRRLTPITREARSARVALARRGLAELQKFDRATLSEAQRTSAAMLAWQLEDHVRYEPFADYAFVFQQFRGLQVQLVNFLSQTHPIRNARDVENYLARLKLVAAQIDEGIAQARDRATRGIVPPRFIIESTLAQLDRFLVDAPRQNVLVASLDERAAKVKSISTETRAHAVAEAEKIVTAEIIPAFRRIQAMLEEQQAVAKNDAGLSRLPGGDKAYANALLRNTTTTMSADEIHALGLKEVARIEAQMDKILIELGYRVGTVGERYAKLELAVQPKDPDPRQALLTRYTELVRDAEKRAESLFDLRPKAPCEVRREPPFTEKTAAAHYTGPSRDGTRPGVFWVPLPGAPFRVVSMRSLTYHEAIPGHHFQIALQSELEELPRFRRDRVFGGLSAHSEGWALYAERLAAENDWYAGDKIGALGQLDSELFRARRLVVDTGLHTKGWTRQQAIDYGIKASEVERYVVTPGQACAYKIGELRILAIRDKARRELGAKFSVKEFHNVILRNGNVPLAVLEEVVDNWVRAQR
jgi:uncharacterized protein (DUF885 family)